MATFVILLVRTGRRGLCVRAHGKKKKTGAGRRGRMGPRMRLLLRHFYKWTRGIAPVSPPFRALPSLQNFYRLTTSAPPNTLLQEDSRRRPSNRASCRICRSRTHCYLQYHHYLCLRLDILRTARGTFPSSFAFYLLTAYLALLPHLYETRLAPAVERCLPPSTA